MITAIILAAGQSIRMGQSKMLLPWGQTRVICKVIDTILEAGIKDIIVVTGSNRLELKKALTQYEINFVFNPDYENGEMLLSFQAGLRSVSEESEAVLCVLGDQPQIETSVVGAIIEFYKSTKDKIIVPSYQMHRGHPWLVARPLWDEILGLKQGSTLKVFLNHKQEEIHYINLNTPSIILDVDTPEDYRSYKP